MLHTDLDPYRLLNQDKLKVITPFTDEPFVVWWTLPSFLYFCRRYGDVFTDGYVESPSVQVVLVVILMPSF